MGPHFDLLKETWLNLHFKVSDTYKIGIWHSHPAQVCVYFILSGQNYIFQANIQQKEYFS